MRLCEARGCDRKHRSKGYCGGHYARVRKYGDPLVGTPLKMQVSSREESWLLRTEPLPWAGCLLWTGPLTEGGYGVIHGEGKSVLAHRYAWEREHGPIPEGKFIDHQYHCDRACVEVSHLRPATPQENTYNRRGVRPGRKHDLPRNIAHSHHGGFDARVRKAGVVHIRWSRTLEGATKNAEGLRQELFGEFAGNG